MGIPNLKYSRPLKAKSCPPTILREPSNQQIRVGTRLSVSVITDDSETAKFQWYHNGLKIPGAKSYRFSITTTKYEHAGAYSCEVKNSFGSVISRVAQVSFVEQKIQSILLQPALATIPTGRPFCFFVDDKETDLSNCIFQWLFNGSKIRGATGSRLEIFEVKKKHEGEYKALIIMGSEIVSTNTSRLRVIQSERFPFAREEIVPSATTVEEEFFYDPSGELPESKNEFEAISDVIIENHSEEPQESQSALTLPVLNEDPGTEPAGQEPMEQFELLNEPVEDLISAPISEPEHIEVSESSVAPEEKELSLVLNLEDIEKIPAEQRAPAMLQEYKIEEEKVSQAALPTEPRPTFELEMDEKTKSTVKKRSALEKMLTLFKKKAGE